MTLTELTNLVSGLLGDKASLNRLDGFESEFLEPDVLIASRITLLAINNKGAHKTGYSINDCPEYLLVLGVSAQLLESKINLKTRNTLAINDGGIAINREGNLELYRVIWAALKREFIDELDMHKSDINFMSGWGD